LVGLLVGMDLKTARRRQAAALQGASRIFMHGGEPKDREFLFHQREETVPACKEMAEINFIERRRQRASPFISCTTFGRVLSGRPAENP
jgi:hypothetical protein